MQVFWSSWEHDHQKKAFWCHSWLPQASNCLESCSLEWQAHVEVILGCGLVLFHSGCVGWDSQRLFVKASMLNTQKMGLFCCFPWAGACQVCGDLRGRGSGCVLEHTCQCPCCCSQSGCSKEELYSLSFISSYPPLLPTLYGQNNTLFSLSALLEGAELF